jgi:hypothetical protein
MLLVLCLSAWCFAANFSVYEANYPGVKDYNVRVDEANLTVIPRGAHIEMNLELTVSYDFKSWFFKNYNELEFLWEFSLPDHASIIDFWIELDDTLRRATMLDRWTAELLFSEVSSPVRHPALLTQSFPDREGLVHYQLRLYPIMRDVKRLFRIHYLVPARPTNETLRVWLPTSQLTSRISPGVKELHVTFQNPEEPQLLGAQITAQEYDPEEQAWQFNIELDYDQFVELVYSTPIQGKHFFSTYSDGAETFYQLAVYPPEVAVQRVPRKYLVLYDFNRFNTDGMDGELILTLLKETMQQALNDQDEANIFVSFEDIVAGADDLLPCSEQNIDLMFENVLRRSFPSYSNFQMLVAMAAEFLKNRDNIEVIMLTNTDEIQLYGQTREDLADEIIAMFPANTRFHVVDLENISSLVYDNDQNQYVTQLQSFYGHLCNKTGGNLFFLRYHSIKNILAALFYEKISHFQEVEVQTRFATGYAYGKNLIALHQGYYPLRFPIMQVGRFRGELPLDVTTIGKVRLDKAVDSFTLTQVDVVPGDSTLATAWYADHIHELTRQSQTNATVTEIMDISLKHRILTPYTGYLVFRPGENIGYDTEETGTTDGSGGERNDGGGADFSGGDSGVPTDVESGGTDAEVELAVKAFPNPFNLAVSIQISLPQRLLNTDVEFAIYNMLGQKVKEFDIKSIHDNYLTLTWDGTSETGEVVSSGVYFAVLVGKDFRTSVKLLLMK